MGYYPQVYKQQTAKLFSSAIVTELLVKSLFLKSEWYAFFTGEKKRKRTSIAAPEKRSLEAYFAVQPRPSGEKIAAIAEKLDLKKNVVRVWFCNQRQKQKRMKFAAQAGLWGHASLATPSGGAWPSAYDNGEYTKYR